MTRTTPPKRRAARQPQKRKRAASASKAPQPQRVAVLLGLAVLAVVVWLVASARPATHDTATHPDGSQLNVVTNPALPEEILEREGMTISFNPQTHQPNWVSWELLASETSGSQTRKEAQFAPDPEVEATAYPSDYTNSGFDRGHMAPAGDMKWSSQAMQESFYMTNICPQAGELNRGTWNRIEEKCRQKAVADSAVIIVCGPIFEPGEAVQRIGQTGVAVPRRFFKVVLSPYTDPPTAIGFIVPNGRVPGGMQTHAVSVDSVEAVTGHNFFTQLPPDTEAAVEAQCNFNRWSRVKRR